MAAATKTVTIRFNGDPSGLNRGAAAGEKAVAGFGAKIGGALRGIGTVAAGVLGANLLGGAVDRVRDFVGGSVDAFSNLNESVNAVNQIFGRSAGQIQQWGQKNATSLGLSTRAFNELAVPLGALLKNAGLPLQQVTGWTTKLTERAADMASVFNTDVSTALEAIQAGLRGESDPLEQFGVSLSAARVEAEALSETGKKSAKQLTDQEKATARLNLIMKQTSAVSGDFRNTSDGLANSQRIAAAKTEELQAKIGQKLAPIVAKVTELKLKLVGVVADKVLPAFDRLAKSPLADWVKGTLVPALADFGRLLVDLGGKVADFVGWLNQHRDVALALGIGIAAVLVPSLVAWAVAAGLAAINTLAAVAPILLVVAAVAALAFGIIWLVKNWDMVWGHIWSFMKTIGAWFAGPFVGFFTGAWSRIVGAAKAVFNWVKGNWPLLLGILTGPIGLAVVAIVKNWDKIKASASAAKGWVVDRFNELVKFLKGLPGRVGGAFSGMFDSIKSAFRSAVNWVIDRWNNFHIPGINTHLPGIGTVGGFETPNIPRLATGGRILQSGIAVVHKGEVVRPAQTAPLDTGPNENDMTRAFEDAFERVLRRVTLRIDDRTARFADLLVRGG